MAFTTEVARWRALVTRDANANGQFIYSVRSTNIYCRPTCPGRLARRANVGFYETPFEAEAAGFRACKRCKPNTVVEDPQERAVEKACLLIDEALKRDDPKSFKLDDLAKKVGLTPRYFHKIFKDKTGLTPKEYTKMKSNEHSSTGATPVSMATESSVQSWNWDTFNFNDLVNFGTEPDTTPTDDFLNDTTQTPPTDFGAQFDVDNLVQPLSSTYEPNGIYSGLVVDGKLVDPSELMSARICFYDMEKLPAASTFELDAAAVLRYDSLTDVLLT